MRRLAVADPAHLGPVRHLAWGTGSMRLYDLDAVDRLHAHLAAHRTAGGRPRLWSEQELRQRRAAYSAIAYRRRRAQALRARGERTAAALLVAEAEQLQRDLDVARRARVAEFGSKEDVEATSLRRAGQ